MLSGDAFLQMTPQFDLHPVFSMSAIIHQQEMRVVVIEAGQLALALDVHRVMGWETTLRRRRRERDLKKEIVCGHKNEEKQSA